ncbi:MAG: hypothetical protein IT428_11240 [Planctomycetaceae bacterium]|nr:hypothetical protein [Planctomycetaceae bacterium]
MDPFTVAVVGTILGMVLGSIFWPYLVDWCSKSAIPFIRRCLGNSVGDAFAKLLVWVDKPACASRRAIVGAWKMVTGSVLKMKSTYSKTSATSYLEKRQVHLLDRESGKQRVRTEEYEVPWEQVPERVRDEMVRQGKDTAEVDVKESLLNSIKDRANEQSLVLETAN